METLISFLMAAAVTFFFVRRYLARLTAPKKAVARSTPPGAAALERATHPCPRCEKPIPARASFCPECGAPLALWKVHRAAIRVSSSEQPKGRPRPVINVSVCIGCGTCATACPESALDVVNGKSRLVHPERCAGHGKCAQACPTQALTLPVSGAVQIIRVPHVKENFETNVPGIYIIGELGGKAMIKTAINEGLLAVEGLRRRLAAPAEVPSGLKSADLFDVAIIGAGPAGLSASLAAHQYGLNYLTLEQGEIASTIRHYPRHKLVMAEPVEMPLWGNLYIAESDKESLLAVWETIIAKTGVRIRTNHRVESIRRKGPVFELGTPKGSHLARYLVLAMGKRGTPRRLQVPGEELGQVCYRLTEAESYHDADILVVGGGDSALEATLGLANGARNRVTLSYREAQFDKARERNRIQLELAEKAGKLRVLRQTQVIEIRPETVRLDCFGHVLEIPVNYVFVLIGGETPEAFLRRTGIEIVEKAIS